MRADVQIAGLSGLRSRLGDASRRLDNELRPAIRDAANEMKAEARKRAPGNRLPNSVQMRTLEGGLSAIVGSVAKTALSIEQGRQRGEMPRVGLIVGWMGRKGIVSDRAVLAGATQRVKDGRVMKRGGKPAAAAQRALAWKIAMSIRERGTRPLPFIIPAASAKKVRASQLINAAVGRFLGRVAR